MDTRMLKILQGLVVTSTHVHVSHYRQEPLPGQVLVPQKVLRNFLESSRRGGCVNHGRDLPGQRILWLRIKSEDLHRGLQTRGRRRLDTLKFGRLVLLILPSYAWEVTQVHPRWDFFLFSPVGGRGWDLTPSSTTSLPLFSFIIAIPKRKDVSFPYKNIYIYIQQMKITYVCE